MCIIMKTGQQLSKASHRRYQVDYLSAIFCFSVYLITKWKENIVSINMEDVEAPNYRQFLLSALKLKYFALVQK